MATPPAAKHVRVCLRVSLRNSRKRSISHLSESLAVLVPDLQFWQHFVSTSESVQIDFDDKLLMA